VVDVRDPLGWRQVGDLTVLKVDASQGPENMVWQGPVQLPNPRPAPMRLVVREREVLTGDKAPTVVTPAERDQQSQPGTFDTPYAERWRTVFADALILP
jgi:hypothetical protein